MEIRFPTPQNGFWTHWFWCFLVLLLFFFVCLIVCFTSSTSAKHFPLRTFFSSEETKHTQKMLLRARSDEWEGQGLGFMLFLVNTCWTLSTQWAGVFINHPSWNGQTRWKSIKKRNHWSQTQPLTTTPYGTDTDGFLEYLPSRGSLYYKKPTL